MTDKGARREVARLEPVQADEFRGILENLPDATFVHEDAKFVYTNAATLKLLAASERSQLLGRSILDFIPEEDRAGLLNRLEKIHEHPQRFEERVLRLDGTVIEVESRCVSITLKGKRMIQTVLREISERKNLEAQLRQAQKMEAIGTLAGGIAHDFNNILAAIVAFTELAKMEAEQQPAILENLNEVMKASQRAKDLVSQILTFSRQKTQEKRSIQLGLVVKEALRLLRATLPSSIQIISQIDSAAPAVFADPSQIHQVLMNLCTNAAHALGKNNGRLEIRLERADEIPVSGFSNEQPPSGPYAKLSVIDTGHGMSEETLKRIFDPFFTTKAPGEGTGLGLAVVHGIIQDHDGVIRSRSQPGIGTTFELFFPACDPDLNAPITQAGKLPMGGGEHILVVDDEPALARVTARILQRLGYTASAETDPVQALERFRQNPQEFDLVLSDLTMPNTTGVELAVEILKIRPSTPVLVCTGFTSYWEREALQTMGISDLLYKPLSPSTLAQTIHQALQRGNFTNARSKT